MKKSFKTLAALVTAGVMVFGMTSCGGGTTTGGNETKPDAPATTANSDDDDNGDDEGETPAPTGEAVEISISWWGSDGRHDAMNAVAELYMQKNPNVTVKTAYGAWDGWQQRIMTELSGKTETDIVQVNYNWIHSFNKGKNVFYDLNELSGLDLSNWTETDLGAMTVGGELAAVPHGTTARANLYSKPLFEEAGIEYPTSYEELIAAGAIIGADNTATGAENKYIMEQIGKQSMDLFIAQMLFNETGKPMQTDGVVNYLPSDVAKAFDTLKSFEDSGALPTFAQQDPIENESNPVWTSGRLGSVYEWVGTMDKYLDSYKNGEANDEISVAPFITETGAQNIKVYAKPNLGFAISKNAKNPEVAADYINFMFTDPEAVKIIGTNYGISCNTVTRDIQDKEGFVTGAMQIGYELLENYDLEIMDPYFEDENVRGERFKAIEEFRTGKSDSATAAQAYIDDQQAALDKLYK